VFKTLFQQQFWNIFLKHQIEHEQNREKQETCIGNNLSRVLLANHPAMVSLVVDALWLINDVTVNHTTHNQPLSLPSLGGM